MMDFKNMEGIYFVGIGGIGMSALALYFVKGGHTVAGYDRSESSHYTVPFTNWVVIFPMTTVLIQFLNFSGIAPIKAKY